FGWSGRCAPACGLALGLGADGSEGFWPLDGGTLELSGVLGGRPNFASSSATRAVRASTCPANAPIVSACAKTRRINVSLSSDSTASRFIQSLNQALRRLSKSLPIPTIDRR